jgi:tetratricopeptide (TPR) repeat protein
VSPGFKIIQAGCILLLLTGCMTVIPAPQPSRTTPPPVALPTPPKSAPPDEVRPPAPPPPKTTEIPRETPSPRALASLELSRQAQSLIEEGKPDEAIRILEQAVNLHPGSGENYYYLAEAWRRKGNLSQASEYNNLASIRFKDNPEWMERIALQKKRIDRIR